VAVIIQGPIIRNDDYTFETARYYRSSLSQKVIVSTWADDVHEKERKRYLDIDVDLVLSQKPKNPGVSNVNMQIVSTLAGLRVARQEGCKFALKTRTDLRIYSPEAVKLMRSISRNFPITTNTKQASRIIGLSHNTFKYRVYSLSDLVLFGDTCDLERYFDVQLDQSSVAKQTRTLGEWSRERYCEAKFFSNFIEGLGEPVDFTLRQYHLNLSKRFAIVDAESVDLHWPKYSLVDNRYQRYGRKNSAEIITYAYWLSLFDFPSSIEPIEDIQNLEFDADF
jgi:hypothetical protein